MIGRNFDIPTIIGRGISYTSYHTQWHSGIVYFSDGLITANQIIICDANKSSDRQYRLMTLIKKTFFSSALGSLFDIPTVIGREISIYPLTTGGGFSYIYYDRQGR